MATNTEVAGISIGISADIGGLTSSLGTATTKINAWMQLQQKKSVGITVEAVKGASWTSLESDLNKLVEKVTAGHSVPINVEMHIEDAAKEKARLETIVKNQLGNLKVPIDIEYNTNINIKSHVEVTWSWADGHGPPTHMGGGPSGGDDGGTPPTGPTKKRGRKTAATGGTTTETETEEQAPVNPPKTRRRGATPAGEGGTVTVKPTTPKAPQAEKPAGGGIEAMPTGTPQNAAKRAKEATIADNTARRQEEAGEDLAVAAREWRDITRGTFLRNLRKVVSGQENLRVSPGALEGATGFQAEYEGTKPTGSVAYRDPSGTRHSLMRSRTPRTFEGTTHGERPTEGRVVESYRRDPNDPRRNLADARTMSWFDPDEGFVDPAVRAQGQKLFNEAMGAREKEVYDQLKGVVEQREGETQEEFSQRLLRDWTQAGWGFNAGKTFTTKATTLEGISSALQQSPAMAALDKLRSEGKFGEFFGDEATPGALQLRATQQSLIRARKVAEAEAKAKESGKTLTEQERKAALSKGTQRATNLRGGNALPEPGRPEEMLYVHLNAMIGQAFKDQYFAERKLQQEQATAQGQESTITNEMVAKYTETEGERPISDIVGTRTKTNPRGVKMVAVPTGKLKEVIDRDKGLRTTGEPRTGEEAHLGMWHTKVIPEMEMVQDQAGLVIKRLRDKNDKVTETNEEYEARVTQLQSDWDEGLIDFAGIFEMPAIGGEKASRPRQRKPGSAGASAVGLTDFQKKIQGWQTEYEKLAELQQFGEPFDEDRLAELEQMLAEVEATGGQVGSRRTRVIPRQQRVARAEGLVSESQRKLEAASDPASQAYYQRQLRQNQTRLSRAKVPTTAEKGLTGPHRTAGETVRAEMGFCEYCQMPFAPGGGEAEHPISRTHGGGQAPIGGPEQLMASCRECNLEKGPRDILEYLQDPTRRRPAAVIDTLAARAAQPAGRQRDLDVLGLRGTPFEGSARRRKSELIGPEPIDVPDVRDYAAAMGIKRGGFGASGQRIKMTAGSREKMLRAVKNSDDNMEKVYALLGDRYVDELDNVLLDIREVVELETDPRKTSDKGFAVSKKGLAKLHARQEQTGLGQVGLAHSHKGEGLLMSEPGKAAIPGQDDLTALKRMNEEVSGFISMIIDPSTKEGIRAYQVGSEGQAQARSVSIGKNIPRMAAEPVQAQAAQPAGVSGDVVGDLFNQMSDSAKAAHVEEMLLNTGGIPAYAESWAKANAELVLGTPMTNAQNQVVGAQKGMFGGGSLGGQAGPSPFRWNMGAANVGQAGYAGAAAWPPPPPPPGAQQGGAAAGAPPPVPPPGQGGFWQQGGGGAPPPPPAGSPPAGAGGQKPMIGAGQGFKYQRSRRDIREEALQAGVPYRTLQNIESGFESDYIQVIQEADQIAGQIQEDIGKTPVRAFTTAIGQYASQLFVRGEVGERRIAAQTLGRMFRKAGQERFEAGVGGRQLTERLATGRAAGEITPGSDEETRLLGQIELQEKTYADADKAVDFFGKELATAAKGVAPLSTQMLNLATITGSMVVAGVAFQAGMQIASKAFEMFSAVAMEGAESATGFSATLKRVQEELAKPAFERGEVSGAVSSGFAAAGMEPSEAQRGLLEGQVGAVVATQRATAQRDMLRSMENLRGLGGGEFGMAPGLTRPTGGLFGTNIGAQQSLDEVVGNELERLQPGGPLGWFASMGEQMDPFFDMLNPGSTPQAGLRQTAQQDYLDSLNKELASVKNTAQFAPGTRNIISDFNTQEVKDQTKALNELGAVELAAAVESGAVEIRDANGKIVTEQEKLAGIISDLGEAFHLITPRESYMAGGAVRARNAAYMQIEDRYANQRRNIDIGEFRRLSRNVPMPFGTTFNTGDQASRRAAQQFGGQFQDLAAGAEQRRLSGRQQALDMGVPESSIRRVESLGKAIAAIRVDLTQRALVVNTMAYEHSLQVAKRTVGDLIGLTGQLNAGQATAVGLAEAENLALERRNTVLGRQIQGRQLELSQRQINFNLATAQFTSSGATPAEAAARMREAQVEADFAQKNLNDQREIFDNAGTIFENQVQIIDEQNLRSLNDAIHAVSQLEAEHELEKYAAGAQEVLAMLEGEADYYGQQVDNDIERASAYVSVAQDEIRRVYVETGKILVGVQEDVADAFEQIREDYDEWLGDIGFSQLVPEGSDDGLTGTTGEKTAPPGTNAAGALFNTAGTHHMIVGEAGTETVAVLRNPRQMMMGMGEGGGQNIQIVINNPVVRNDSDIERIARAVEETLRQRAALVRPR